MIILSSLRLFCFKDLPYETNHKKLVYICAMTTLANIKQVLSESKFELQVNYGVCSIGLFGSIVRDDFTASSDIDIVVEFDRPVGIGFVHLVIISKKNLRSGLILCPEMESSQDILL